jgi:hypothetical protein
MHVPTPAEHAQHDLDLIAAHVAGDLTDTERIRADGLLQSCNSCADLRRDLLVIATATRALPRTARAPRDFRLDAAQAERLRGGGWFRTLLRPFRTPQSVFRPMAAAFTTLGLAGLLVANVLPSLFGSAGSAAPLRDQSQAAGATAAAAPAASEAPVLRPMSGGGAGASPGAEFQGLGQASPAADSYVKSNAGHTAAPVAGAPVPAQSSSAAERLSAETNGGNVAEPAPMNPLVLGSVVLVALGLALFGLRFAARRFG